MATEQNQVRKFRLARGWSQAELAERTGISRTAISAMEGARLVPSVAAALSLARAFETTVEELFAPSADSGSPVWCNAAGRDDQPYWQAEVAGRQVRYPAGSAPMVALLADSIAARQPSDRALANAASQTLVLACCDPAAGLLAGLFHQSTGMRLLVLPHSSSEALALLKQGLVHLAGIHLATDEEPQRNAECVREKFGPGYRLLRIANWQEGVTAHPTLRLRSLRSAARSKLTWVGREVGSGARKCLDQLLASHATPKKLARHHRGVAETVQSGWADAGVCVQLASTEAGLDFLPVQQEAYDVCYSAALQDDHRMRAFLEVVRSPAYRGLLATLPGYSNRETGSTMSIN